MRIPLRQLARLVKRCRRALRLCTPLAVQRRSSAQEASSAWSFTRVCHFNSRFRPGVPQARESSPLFDFGPKALNLMNAPTQPESGRLAWASTPALPVLRKLLAKLRQKLPRLHRRRRPGHRIHRRQPHQALSGPDESLSSTQPSSPQPWRMRLFISLR